MHYAHLHEPKMQGKIQNSFPDAGGD